MVQLTLTDGVGTSLDETLSRLEADATVRLGCSHHPACAVDATRRHFHRSFDGPMTERDRRRVSAYFNAVLRRRVLTSRDSAARRIRLRMVAVAMEDDLVSGGWTRDDARAESERALGLPPGRLEGAA